MFKPLTLACCLLVVTFSFQSCKKDKEKDVASVIFKLEYSADSLPLIFDSLMYINDAGNQYSVSRLQYYISDIRLTGDKTYYSNEIFYIDARESEYNSLELKDIDKGSYTGISFLIGLSAEKNISNALPNTMENLNMAWPDMMGGGYHFIKLEGQHKTGSTTASGFAVHLGRNAYVVSCNISYPVTVNSDLHEMILKMNLNEWFRNPYQYDFNVDGNYTMSDTSLMSKIANNGKDVFSITGFTNL